MLDILLIIWFVFFVIFFLAGLLAESYALGTISGLIFLLLGLAIISTGIQIQSGETMTIASDTITTEYDYEDATLPYSTYSYVWGIIIILVGIFITYSNAEKL